MKQGKKRIFSLLLCAVMAFTLFPATTARAADSVPYLDYENGGYVTRYAADASLVASGSDILWDSGWYLVEGNVSIGARFINGDVRLILADGASLTVGESGGDYAGLTVPQYGTLSIYTQSSGSGMGKLIATGVGNAAGIGSSGASGSCGTINIYGGDITATGSGIGAGIGASVYGSCDAINIYGGKITATGGGSGAGIGNVAENADAHFGAINIYDGFVTATNGVNNLFLPDIGGSGDETDSIHICGGAVVSGRTPPQINLGNHSYRSSNPDLIIDGGSLRLGSQYSVGEMKPVVNGAGDAVSTFPAQLTIPGKHNARVASILIGGTPFGNGAYTDGTGTLSLYLVESDHVRPVVVAMEDESSFWGVLQPGGFNLVTLADAETQRINPESTGFAKFMPMDVAVYLLDASSFTGISLEGSPLNAGTDYTVAGGTVTIKASYLQTLPGGTAALTFHFDDTSTATLTVTIYDPPNYVALGDSIAAGYGLEDYDPMAPTPPQDAYASLVAQGMPGSVLGCLTYSGMDSGVFLHLLDSPGLEAYLQNANVLTLSIGSDDILQPFLQTVADTLDCRIDRIQQALAEVMLDASAYQSFLTDLSSALSTDSGMAEGLARFEENFPQIIAKLKSAAPSARIYVTNIYNPYLGVSLPPLDLGAFTDTYVSALNVLLSAPSPDYTLIDVYGAFATASANPATYPVNVNLATMNFDPHPNAAGHQIIANLILTAISSNAGHTVTFNLNGGTHAGGGALRQTVANGGAATAPTVTRGGYTFVGWDRAFTNVTADLTVTANWIANGGTGPSPAAPAAPPVVPPMQQPGQPVTAAIPVTATPGTNGSAMLNISVPAISGAISSAQAAEAQGSATNGIAVELNVAMPPSTSSLTTGIPQAALQNLVDASVTSFVISGAPVTLSYNQSAIQALLSLSNGGILLNIAPASAPMPPVIGTHPAFEINIGTGANEAQNITGFGSGAVLIGIPYQPASNETPNGLFGVYVDGNGNPSRIPGSSYNANAGAVLLPTSHNSVYGVGYEAPSARFTDIGGHWAKDSIDYVVGRGLFSGTSATGFSPDTAMTRGMLVTALGRLAGVDARAYAGNSFTDVKADSPFRPYIEWAYGKGIVEGVGNGQFAPDKAITREEIAVIVVNYAKATGYRLPATRAASDFADAASVGSTYQDAVTAMQQAGIMMGGTNNMFNPKGNATRAEVSAMLDRYIRLTIAPATAEGWALGDDGKYLYYRDGKALTAWQTIDGEKYFFRADGSLQTSWVKDGDNWRYYDRNKAAEGWLDIGGTRYYFDADGSMSAKKWLQIDGKWYYFNADGALARNTKIDGYEVDENGVRKNQ